jgi:hypothetical protein
MNENQYITIKNLITFFDKFKKLLKYQRFNVKINKENKNEFFSNEILIYKEIKLTKDLN